MTLPVFTGFEQWLEFDTHHLPRVSCAMLIAIEMHGWQLDKQGEPYIVHALAVGMAGRTENERIVGILHDVAEDCVLPIDHAVFFGAVEQKFGADIAHALRLLTRTAPFEYAPYIERIAEDALATAVKLNDLRHNLSRYAGLPLADQNRLRPRYERAVAVLEIAQYKHSGRSQR